MTISNTLCAFASLQIVLGAFLPISIHYEAASLEARDEQERDCFKPTQSVDLYYIEGKQAPFPTHSASDLLGLEWSGFGIKSTPVQIALGLASS